MLIRAMSAAIAFSLGTFFSTLIGGLAAVKMKNHFGILAAFVAGVLVAVPLFDLLPEALRLAGAAAIPAENVMYAVALGFVFLFVLDRYISVHRICEHGVCRNVRHPQAGLFGASELAIHSFMDGFAIGLGFQVNAEAGVIIGIAVVAHDFSDGMNTVTVMLSAGNSWKASMRMLIVDALAPVVGALSTLVVAPPQWYLAYLLPFFAGGFFYLGASDLLPEAHEKNPPLVSLVSTIGGFVVIFVIIRFLAH
jgi:zinc transporter, ZIP family